MFTVRWPLFARLEAVLLFPPAVGLAHEIPPLRLLAARGLLPTLSPIAARLSVPAPITFWVAMALLVVVPYFTVVLLADRFLTVRKGYALLSFVAVALWTGAAFHWASPLTHLLSGWLPARLSDGTGPLPIDQQAALSVGALALLLHLPPAWTGLRDHGEVAERLLERRRALAYRKPPVGGGRQDVYMRQTAEFREWETQLDGMGGGPRESPMVKFLTAITWLGVLAGMGAAYGNWNGMFASNHAAPAGEAPARGAPPGGVTAGGFTAGGVTAGGDPTGRPAALAATKPPALPINQGAPSVPPANVHTIAIAPMPSVQRPTELSASTQSGTASSGPNEAVAERGGDGSFVFDAVINGSHARMIFDTGATAVGLRAEDAVRMGIPMGRLNYSAKMKTANGTAEVAPVMIDTMLIGNITLRNVPGFVAKEGMLAENLLGQTFLARLAGFDVEGKLLVLRGR